MRIGMIGAGAIGSVLARHFVETGHEVALCNSRGPESLHELVSELGARARATTVDDAATFGDIVVLAVPFREPGALPPREKVRGKIVIDAMNPYRTDGTVEDFSPGTSSEETLKRLPGCRLVKAFNTIWSEHLKANPQKAAPRRERHAIPVAGDDKEAVATVKGLIEQIGFAAVDSGSLREGGRKQQPNTAVYNNPMRPDDMERLLES